MILTKHGTMQSAAGHSTSYTHHWSHKTLLQTKRENNVRLNFIFRLKAQHIHIFIKEMMHPHLKLKSKQRLSLKKSWVRNTSMFGSRIVGSSEQTSSRSTNANTRTAEQATTWRKKENFHQTLHQLKYLSFIFQEHTQG